MSRKELFSDNWNEYVTIRLKRWQIPIVTGAMRLGTHTEHWCSILTGKRDSIKAYKWISCAKDIMDNIKSQTFIGEDREHCDDELLLEKIDKLIKEQCKKDNLIFEPYPDSKFYWKEKKSD